MVSQSYILPTAVTNVLRLFSVTEHQKFCQTDGIVPSDHSFCIIYQYVMVSHPDFPTGMLSLGRSSFILIDTNMNVFIQRFHS